jgi:molybdopterin-guanine dinucleotide biosynthesis protein A
VTALLAVIAGGAARRFGRDKTQLPIDGTTLLARTAALGRDLGLDVAVIGHDRPAAWPPHLAAVTFHADEQPGHGPLGGLVTALALAASTAAAPAPSVLAVAADLPALDRQALAWLLALDAAPPAVHARIPLHATHLEPLFALYRPPLLPALRARRDRGDHALHRLTDEPGVDTVPAPAWLPARLININTPADWAKTLVRAGDPEAHRNPTATSGPPPR